MRLLHARHRDEPVRALPSAARPRRAKASTRRSPAISAAAPATGRSSTRRSRPSTARRRTGSPPTAERASRRSAALDDGRDLFVGDEAAFFAAPASEAALADLYARHPDAVLLGGATDVGLWITKQLPRPEEDHLARPHRAASRRSTSGAGRPAASAPARRSQDATPHLNALHPDLGALMSRFGSAQVRASGTVGGNIANGSPIGDLAPALIALGARGRIAQGRDVARASPLEDFFIAYGKQDRSARANMSRALDRAAARRRARLSRLQSLASASTRTFPP